MKRDRLEIMVDMLLSAKDGANKTKIVYDAFLNFRQANGYLDYLMEAELIAKKNTKGNKTIYKTTDKGIEMLERFNDLIELKSHFN